MKPKIGYMLTGAFARVEVWKVEVVEVIKRKDLTTAFKRKIYRDGLVRFKMIKPIWWEPGQPQPTRHANELKTVTINRGQMALNKEELHTKLKKALKERVKEITDGEERMINHVKHYKKEILKMEQSIMNGYVHKLKLGDIDINGII